jgi:hypothetical protein
MKNLFKPRFVLTAVIVFGIALIVSRTSFAQEAVSTGLETQISRLVDTLDKLLVAEKEDTAVTTQTEEVAVMAAAMPSGTVKPSCMDNWQTWNHSNTFHEGAPWNLDFIARKSYPSADDAPINTTEQFIDLNGDGLSDYIYDYRYYYVGYGNKYTKDQTCVYLSNGNGFDLAYHCYADIYYLPTASQDFYGDCAG